MYILTIILLSVSVCSYGYIWHDCGKPDATVRFVDFVAPDPFKITDTLTFGMTMNVTEPIEWGSYTKLDLKRNVNLVLFQSDVTIPCIRYCTEAFCKFGTCEYDFCGANLSKKSYICDFVKKKTNGTCSCPFKPQVYSGYNYSFKLPLQYLRFLVSMFANVCKSIILII